MNLEEQTVSGVNQIHLTDALNAALFKLKVSRNSMTTTMPANITIYVDKQERTNPSSERREYVFPLNRQIVFLYESAVSVGSDEFIIEPVVENNDIFMKTYVIRNITDWDEDGNRNFATVPEIEEVESTPIVLFEGENYIYTNYEVDGMDMELVYPKNTNENKMLLNSAIYYSHKENNSGEFSLDDIYFKDAFTKTEDKLNLEVDNANVECITSKNNKFSLDEDGNLTVNSINVNNTNLQTLAMYPVGSIYFSVNDTNPTNYFGGTWELWGAGRVPVGVDATQSDFNSVEKTGGANTVTLTSTQIPSHTHTISSSGDHTHTYTGFIQNATSSSTTYTSIAHKRYESDGTSTPASMNSSGAHTHTVANTGGSGSHNNLQPYITCYMWKRTA